MNTIVPISRDDDRLELASRWVLKLDEGLTSTERAALETWLTEDSKNANEFVEVARAWDKLDSLTRLADLFPIEHAKPVVSTRPTAWLRSTWVAIAASVFVVTTAAAILLLSLDLRWLIDDQPLQVAKVSRDYETAIGEQSSVVLPDGTVVVLNTNSRMDVSYSTHARVIELLRGEIHVEVAEDRTRPLSVVAGDRIVQAVGTSFSVEITQDKKIELMVTDGKVVVGIHPASVHLAPDRRGNDRAIPVPPIIAPTDTNTVAAGEELVLGAPEEVVVPVSAEEIEVRLSWREGRLIFRSEPLESALQEVERYTTVEFVLLDEDLKTRTLSGRFRAGDVEALLASLRLNFDISHEFDGENRVLLSRLQ